MKTTKKYSSTASQLRLLAVVGDILQYGGLAAMALMVGWKFALCIVLILLGFSLKVYKQIVYEVVKNVSKYLKKDINESLEQEFNSQFKRSNNDKK